MVPTSAARRFPCQHDFDAHAALECLGGRQSNGAYRHEELVDASEEMRVVSHGQKPTPLVPKRAQTRSGLKFERDTLHTRISTFLADDASMPGTYGHTTITNPPTPSYQKKVPTTVSLTPAEARVLTLLTTYRTLSAIGTELGIGRPTVKTHVHNIYKKLGAANRADAVNRAESAGLLPRP